LAEAMSVRRDDLAMRLGWLPRASTHAAQLAIDVLRTALGSGGAGTDRDSSFRSE
jgi:hypothetical protein